MSDNISQRMNYDKWEDFQEALEDNIYFNMRGCSVEGSIKIPREWFYQILNWSGECTEPNAGEDYYKNPRAMYVALDLIYRLLDCIEEEYDPSTSTKKEAVE